MCHSNRFATVRPLPHRCRPNPRTSPGSRPLRRGITTVEFAMTAPLLFLLLYAALELSHANMTFNTVEAACYEGARVGIVPGAKASECQAAAERILTISKIQGANVTVTPTDLNTSTQSVQVRISVPYAQTAIIPPTFTRLLTINRQCELVREKL
ncbi:MAG: TadE/TadG family type IV pilus assembly protein [Aureliella sp.]